MRRHRLLNILATTTLISTALVMLIGLLSGEGSSLQGMVQFVLEFVSVVAALAVVIGVFNLIAVHLGRFTRSEHGWPYSMIVLIVMVAVVVLRILDRAEIWKGDLEGEQMSLRAFEAVQVSLESALAALLVFFLVFAAYRLMHRRVTWWSLLFTAAVVIGLLGWIPLEDIDVLSDIRDWLVRVPANAGSRGILIGVGLGTITVGVRVLIGQDRSFRD